MPPSETIGATAAEFGVTPSGTASYTVPIAVPVGTTGVQPKLTLSWSSPGGQGPLGFGGSIVGLSFITRCPTDLYLDGAIDPVDFDANDKFCLNGQRLVAVSGTYGADGTEYRTDLEEFSKVVSYGSAGSGPQRFTVWKKSGEILDYGNTTDSRVEALGRADARLWALNKLSDRLGNYVSYTYFEDTATGDFGISRVDYTGNASQGLAPYNRVDFIYEAAPKTTISYANGQKYTSAKRLTNVKVYAGTTLFRDYRLTYRSASQLDKIEECATAVCLRPTTFTWKADEDPASQPFFTPKLLDTSGITGTTYTEFDVVGSGDFNGDGRTDLYLFKVDSYGRATSNVNDTVWLAKSDGTFDTRLLGQDDGGLVNGINGEGGVSSPFESHRVAGAGDFNGDGLTDLFVYRSDQEGRKTGGFSDFVWLAKGDGTFQTVAIPLANSSGDDYRVGNSGDFNGDGLTDLYLFKADSYGRATTDVNDTVWLSGGDGTFDIRPLGSNDGGLVNGINSEGGVSSPFEYHRITASGDFNGDGLTDLFLYRSDQEGRKTGGYSDFVWLAKGDGTFLNVALPLPNSSGGGYLVASSGEFNGDGLTDLYLYKSYGSGRATSDVNDYVWLSKGDGTFDIRLLGPNDGGLVNGISGDQDVSSPFEYHRVAATGDVNLDGLTDLYVMRVDDRGRKDGSTNIDHVWLAKGDGTFTNASLGAGASLPDDHKVAGSGDFNGDGVGDFYHFKARDETAARSSGDASDYVRLGARLRPDLLTSITNGLGNKVEVVTRPMTDASVYTKGTGAVYPSVDVADTADIVSQVKTDNGIGGQNTQTYTYEALRAHLKGAGSLGFARMTVLDDATQIWTESLYNQDAANRFQGHLGRTRTVAPSGTVLEDKTVTWAVCFFSGTGCVAADPTAGGPSPATRRFLYTRLTTTLKRDLNNADLGATIETSTYDDKGFVTRLDATTSLGAATFSKITDNVYTHDTTNWILGRLTSSTATHKAPGVPDKLRRAAFAYNAANGLMTAETVEPGDPLFHTKTYAHNGFGAVTSVTETWGSPATSGVAATSRTTSYTYDSKVRFKLTETNPLGHSETHVYDPLHGLVTQTTGPNNLATAWTYDAFGLPLEETRADGTKTKSFRYWCDANTACPANGAYVVVSLADGAPLAASYKDRLNRTLRDSTQALDGRTVDVTTEYDARGNVVRKSEPAFDGATALWSTVTYDLLSRPTLTTRADAATQRVAYNGLVQTSTNELGQTKTVTANAVGWMVSSKDHDNNVVTYAYDALGQQTAIVDPDLNRVETDYDVRGNKIAMRDPDRGNWTFRANALGLLVEQTDAKGQKTAATFDVLGRMLTRVDGATAANPAFRTSTWAWDLKPKGIGKLASTEGYGYTASPAYDAIGRPISLAEGIDSATYTVSTTYDSAGRPKTAAYPNGLTVESVYSASGHLSQVRNLGSGLVYWQALAVDARGNVVSSRLGNGVEEARGYEPATGFLTSIRSVAPGAGGTIQDLALTFDRLGNLGRRRDTRANLDETFQYDTLNRVVQVATTTAAAGTPTTTTTVAVAYDRAGNIRSRSDVGTYSYGPPGAGGAATDPNCALPSLRPHAVTGLAGVKNAAYCYDANGDLTSGDGRTVTWSAFGMPTRFARGLRSIDLAYGPDRARFKRIDTNETGQTTTHYVASGAMEAVISAAGSVTRRVYVAGAAIVIDTETLPGVTTPAETRYLLKDHLGSLDVVTDSSGAVLERLSFDAWGKRRKVDWTQYANTGSPLPGDSYAWQGNQITRGYTGHEQLDPVGLVHMNGRVYDPEIGRFLSADAVIQDTTNLQSLNAYSYVLNNPLSFTDPSGFFFKSLFKSIGKFFSNVFRAIGAVFKAVLRSSIGRAIIQIAICVSAGPIACGAAAGGLVLQAGGSIVDAIKATAFAFAQIGIFDYVGGFLNPIIKAASLGNLADFIGGVALKGFVHGTIGGALAISQGGEFLQGFISSGISGAAGVLSDYTPLGNDIFLDTAFVATVGGLVSELSGGKFANGAITAAFANLYNKWEQVTEVAQCFADCALDPWSVGGAAAGGGAVAAGQPWRPYPRTGVGGRTPSGGTSFASAFFRDLFRGIYTPDWLKNILPQGTSASQAARTAKLGAQLGRAVPVVGWSILAVDAVAVGYCTWSCTTSPQKTDYRKKNTP